MDGDNELRTPLFLLAMPQVLDPFFRRSVVLLVQHDDEGSLGFIVNRPTPLGVGDVLQSMDLPWNGDAEARVHFGGPVQQQLGTVLCRAGALVSENATEIRPGLMLTHHSGDLKQLATAPPDAFRLLLGYAGWGAGQLIEEISRHDWITAPVDDELIFGPRPGEAWEAALRSVGIDPATLVWSAAGDGEGEAN